MIDLPTPTDELRQRLNLYNRLYHCIHGHIDRKQALIERNRALLRLKRLSPTYRRRDY